MKKKWLVAILAPVFLTACTHTSITQMQQNNGVMAARGAAPLDKRTDEELEPLLPEHAFKQKEFPKSFVITMFRSCINHNAGKNPSNPVSQAGKVDPFCACHTDEEVHSFTMQELTDGERSHWDMKTVPDLAHRSNAIMVKCMQSTL